MFVDVNYYDVTVTYTPSQIVSMGDYYPYGPYGMNFNVSVLQTIFAQLALQGFV